MRISDWSSDVCSSDLTIECRDAVLNADSTRAEWPEADAVVGNPPFLGNKKMIRELGEDYTRTLRNSWPEVPGGVDLVCYWFAKARSEEHTSELQSLMRISYAVF